MKRKVIIKQQEYIPVPEELQELSEEEKATVIEGYSCYWKNYLRTAEYKKMKSAIFLVDVHSFDCFEKERFVQECLRTIFSFFKEESNTMSEVVILCSDPYVMMEFIFGFSKLDYSDMEIQIHDNTFIASIDTPTELEKKINKFLEDIRIQNDFLYQVQYLSLVYSYFPNETDKTIMAAIPVIRDMNANFAKNRICFENFLHMILQRYPDLTSFLADENKIEIAKNYFSI